MDMCFARSRPSQLDLNKNPAQFIHQYWLELVAAAPAAALSSSSSSIVFPGHSKIPTLLPC